MAGQYLITVAEATPSLEVVESDYLIEICQSLGATGATGAQGEQGEPGADGAGATAESLGDLIAAAAEKITLVDADKVPIGDSEANGILKWLSFENLFLNLQMAFLSVFQPLALIYAHGVLTGASSEAIRTFGPTYGAGGDNYEDHTATIGEGVTAVLSGFTPEHTSIALLLTVTAPATLSIPLGWNIWTTQTLTTMAAGTYLIIFKSLDSGVTGGVWVMVQPS